MLFIDRYKPTNLDEVGYIENTDSMPHTIISGSAGSGKHTLALLFIKEKIRKLTNNIHNKDFDKIEKKNKIFKYSSKDIEFTIVYNDYYYMIDPHIYGVYDKLIIQEFIKKIVQEKRMCNIIPYHLIVIENAAKLTNEAQQSLRRTLEKYISNCRFIFLMDLESKLIDPIMSRCVCIKIPAPTDDKLRSLALNIIKDQDSEIEYSNKFIDNLVIKSENNYKKLLRYLQLYLTIQPDKLKENKVNLEDILDYHSTYNRIIDCIFKHDSVESFISDIRNCLYGLLTSCYNPHDILKELYAKLIRKTIVSSNLQIIKEITKDLAYYNNKLLNCSKSLYHLEAFIISVCVTIHSHSK